MVSQGNHKYFEGGGGNGFRKNGFRASIKSYLTPMKYCTLHQVIWKYLPLLVKRPQKKMGQ
jgi:hypothetical protein